MLASNWSRSDRSTSASEGRETCGACRECAPGRSRGAWPAASVTTKAMSGLNWPVPTAALARFRDETALKQQSDRGHPREDREAAMIEIAVIRKP